MEYKKTIAWKTLSLLWQKPKQLLLFLAFDMLFFLSLFLFSNTMDKLASLVLNIENPNINNLIFGLFYFLLIVLIYSFFKLLILSALFKIHKKTKYDFSLLKLLFPLNIAILLLLIFLLTILLVSTLAFSQVFRQEFMIFTGVIILSLFYILTNLIHINLFKEKSIKKLFKNINFHAWKYIIPLNIFFALLFWLLFKLLSFLTGKFAFNEVLAIVVGMIFTVLLFVYLYLVHLFNRFYLYMVSK
jgi:hypothetical protein